MAWPVMGEVSVKGVRSASGMCTGLEAELDAGRLPAALMMFVSRLCTRCVHRESRGASESRVTSADNEAPSRSCAGGGNAASESA